MKKAKLLSVFLSMLIGMTSLAYAPVTVSAENNTASVQAEEKITNVHKIWEILSQELKSNEFVKKVELCQYSNENKGVIVYTMSDIDKVKESAEKIIADNNIDSSLIMVVPAEELDKLKEIEQIIYKAFDDTETTGSPMCWIDQINGIIHVQYNLDSPNAAFIEEVVNETIAKNSLSSEMVILDGTHHGVPTDNKPTAYEVLTKFIDENKLDASVYIYPVSGYYTTVAYYESDTDIPIKIKNYLTENGYSENSVRFKAYKGEKPEGGMIKDYIFIINKLDECITENNLPADIEVLTKDQHYIKEYKQDQWYCYSNDFDALPVESFATENVQAVRVRFLGRDEVVPKTLDEMYEKENIAPGTVQYHILESGITDTPSQLSGDANCDGELSMADAVLIMQSIANPERFGVNGTDKNHITEQGKKNADITGENDGVTNADALAVQKKLLKLD
jgi:hypothetical protein